MPVPGGALQTESRMYRSQLWLSPLQNGPATALPPSLLYFAKPAGAALV